MNRMNPIIAAMRSAFGIKTPKTQDGMSVLLPQSGFSLTDLLISVGVISALIVVAFGVKRNLDEAAAVERTVKAVTAIESTFKQLNATFVPDSSIANEFQDYRGVDSTWDDIGTESTIDDGNDGQITLHQVNPAFMRLIPEAIFTTRLGSGVVSIDGGYNPRPYFDQGKESVVVFFENVSKEGCVKVATALKELAYGFTIGDGLSLNDRACIDYTSSSPNEIDSDDINAVEDIVTYCTTNGEAPDIAFHLFGRLSCFQGS